MKTKIFNGTLLTPHRAIGNGAIIIQDGKILDVCQSNPDTSDTVDIDAGGNYISPGFIDLHVHGGGGHDFMDGSVQAFLQIAETHARYGTTAMVPTTLTSEKEDLLRTLDLYEQANQENNKGAQFLGMHLEGPYFAQSQRGAQDPRYIRNPDAEEYEEILNYSSSIVRWSAAPELPGSIEFGQRLMQKGILPAAAHTDAIYEEVLEAFENGYTLATHLYSAMSGVTRKNAFRYAGMIESALLLDMDVEIIADGVHLPAPLLKLVYKIKGPDKIALITDAMRAAAMPAGDSILGPLSNGLKVIVEDGVAKLPDRSSFAGSVATADRLVRTMINLADIPLLQAVKMMTLTPARIMKSDHTKGLLVKGKDADIVLFDEDIQIQKTFVNGRLVFDKVNHEGSRKEIQAKTAGNVY
ncbi:N-acetylglucosamine-6-phosphate deacetylase [Dyadobacter sp. CY312]|uniref:N-acetylglucosamine-6-phosphate deacetylase n=1 Tax=Dyadobacter sp. CY312 TaxID=2907303 RepID=UPI001F358913|nr:N-acetylglucosamine-6-phosphate deacetylase [Dyadobacter sp. CY312]MCE7044520.1 N-acetylglucosamine-6-phosphate deacetylase [Dyadobacter sp. CY312]